MPPRSLRATTQRLRAIEHRWIPEHERALAALELALDEADREDTIRVRWVVRRRDGSGFLDASNRALSLLGQCCKSPGNPKGPLLNMSLKQKLALGAAGALAVAGAGAAVAAASGHGHVRTSAARTSSTTVSGLFGVRGTAGHLMGGFGFGRGDDLAAAASYLGITTSALQSDLQSGKTLAQVADSTTNRSSIGLIDALVAHEKTQLTAAVTAGKLTQAQADQITTNLQQRMTDLVNGTHPAGPGPGFGHPGGGPGGDLAAAATYLGITTSELMSDLQSGKTLAQVADSTSNKSSIGLIDALVAQEKTELAAAVTAGKLTQAQSDQITANLQQRVTDLVNGQMRMHFGGGRGGWKGGTPPQGGAGMWGGTNA